jgi:hypothetical protein
VSYRIIATANSTAKIAPAIASGQKLSLGEVFTGPYCRTLNPVPGRPALTYRCPRAVTPACTVSFDYDRPGRATERNWLGASTRLVDLPPQLKR